MRGLSVRQPWAHAITNLGKTVENRTWPARYRGLVVIHASAMLDSDGDRGVGVFRRVAELGEQSMALVKEGSEVRSALVAVAQLADICSESLRWGSLQCKCGRWAVPAQRHFLLAKVRRLETPIPATGALGLWRLKPDMESAVRVQLGMGAQR